MKRSTRIPPRSTKRQVHDGLAEQRADPLKYAPDPSEDQVGGTPDTNIPLSLKIGAGRQHWGEVLGLLVKIRTDCDAAAERLGYASPKDGGLAAVEYIANKILEAIRGERAQQIVSPKRESQTRPTESSQQSLDDYKTRYKTEKPLHRAGHSERTKWIGELKQILRNRKTKSGVLIDPQLAHEIAKQITILNEGITRPETPESIKQMRESIAPFFGEALWPRKKGIQGACSARARKSEAGKDNYAARKENCGQGFKTPVPLMRWPILQQHRTSPECTCVPLFSSAGLFAG